MASALVWLQSISASSPLTALGSFPARSYRGVRGAPGSQNSWSIMIPPTYFCVITRVSGGPTLRSAGSECGWGTYRHSDTPTNFENFAPRH